MTQFLYTSGLSGEINGSLDRNAVAIRKDSLIVAVYNPHIQLFSGRYLLSRDRQGWNEKKKD